MNFLRLFAAGKGLIGMGNSASPYRMKPGTTLPKFGSSKNPFSPPMAMETAKPELCKPEAAPEKVAAVAPITATAKLETASLFEPNAPALEPVKPVIAEVARPATPQLPPIQPAQPELQSVAAAPASEKPATKRLPVSAWVKKFNPLGLLPAILPARMPGASSGRSKAPRAVVQGELSLEKVKVMRNDLSDTDLEIVPARTAMKSARMPSASATAALTLDEETAWDRLTGRIFNTEETQVR